MGFKECEVLTISRAVETGKEMNMSAELVYKEFNLTAYPMVYCHVPGSGEIEFPQGSRLLPNGMIATRRLSFGQGRTLFADSEQEAKEAGNQEMKAIDRFNAFKA